MLDNNTIKKLLFSKANSREVEVESKLISGFEAVVIAHYEDLMFDSSDPNKRLSTTKRCESIGVCVELSEFGKPIDSKFDQFFSNAFGMWSTDFVTLIYEDGSEISYFVPEVFRDKYSHQKIYTDGSHYYGVMYLGFEEGRYEFIENNHLYTLEDY